MDNMVYVMVLLNCAIGICALAILAMSFRANTRVEQFIETCNKDCCWKYEEVKENKDGER